ncbi:periplasmic chaperone for outer membrane proteins Skp [Orbus hercynius]|uniref:Periplasmic chaperone for outer membrane proteins Skp n=1 Tax=Orbus hercynius TaxID=593135 RepID=A0A495RB81_9GAMM|nr:periplasmic chaperone for outer membrane proteins Skp [Orbus hercynius]
MVVKFNKKVISVKKIISVMGLSLALLLSGFVYADTKVGVIDVVSILQQMPQREAVSKALDSEFEPRAKVLQEEEKKANDAAQKLQKDGMTLSTSDKTKLTKIVKAFEDKAKEFSMDYRKRENEEANKLLVKIQEAVKVVAANEKYDLVLKAEAAFYATDTVDITSKVLEQVKK